MKNGIAVVVCAAALGLGAIGAGSALAEETLVLGPPAICTPVECEGESLPWDDSKGAPSKRYSPKQAVADTLRVLDGSVDPLLHMETIRRATICLNDDPAHGNQLLAQLLARAAEAEADDSDAAAKARELAWLDAGYFAGAAWQIGLDLGWAPGESDGVHGLAWLDRAIEAGGGDAAAHYAAAIVGHPAMNKSKRGEYDRHLLAAYEGSAEGSKLRANVKAHMENWGESLTALRDKP